MPQPTGHRATRYPHTSERRLLAITIALLDPDRTKPRPALPSDHLQLTQLGAIRHALTRNGLTATITQSRTDLAPILTAANPCQPYRGTIIMTSDGELTWRARAPHHPDGGIPIPDIATTITRALTSAEHPATSHPQENPA